MVSLFSFQIKGERTPFIRKGKASLSCKFPMWDCLPQRKKILSLKFGVYNIVFLFYIILLELFFIFILLILFLKNYCHFNFIFYIYLSHFF